MTAVEFVEDYWEYYLTLESNFINTFRYVALDKKNKKCYSVEFFGLIQSICSEIDSVMKVLCGLPGNSKSDIANILKYKQILENKNIFLHKDKINIERSNYNKLIPFKEWKNTAHLNWWKIYTTLKHDRLGNIEDANQYNVLLSLSALYLLEVYLIKTINKNNHIIKESQLFNCKAGEGCFSEEVYLSTTTDKQWEEAMNNSD